MTGIQTLAGILLIFPLLISFTSGNDAAWTLIKKFQKLHFESSIEETRVYNTFLKNLDLINKHNTLHANGNSTFTVGMNKFICMNSTEMSRYKGYAPNEPSRLKGLKSSVNYNSSTQPDSEVILGSVTATGVDTRNHCCQKPIDDQGSCGCCYAFSTCHQLHFSCCLMNSSYFSNTSNTHAEQELVSCSGSYGNMGCNGGSMIRSYNYINESGIANGVDYPYDCFESSCEASSFYDIMDLLGIFICDIVRVPKNNCTALEQAVSQNFIVSAAICTVDTLFSWYTGGVYYSTTCNQTVDHAVLVVGFTVTYWIIKNSWSTDWGVSGYAYIGRNNTNGCGLCTMASYVSLCWL